jgi:hypothetical protein
MLSPLTTISLKCPYFYLLSSITSLAVDGNLPVCLKKPQAN